MNDSSIEASGFALEFMGPRREVIPLGERPVSIGRHSENSIFIEGNLASRFHCIIWGKRGKAWVKDLNSSNGTLVNGKRVASLELAPNDIVKVGNTEIRLIAFRSATAPAPSLPPLQKPRYGAAPLLEEVEPPKSLNLEEPYELRSIEELEIVDDQADGGDQQEIEVREEADDSGPPDLAALEDIAGLERHPVESLTDADVVELGPEDLVDQDDGNLTIPDTIWSRSLGERASNDEPIPLAGDDIAEPGYDVDTEAILEELAESLPDHSFAASDIGLLSARGQVIHPAGKAARRGDAVDLFRRMLVIATRGRVTDIHIEPRDGGFQVRMRVDGTMVNVVRMPNPTGIKVQALVKVLGELDLAERNSIQEGHFSSLVPSDRSGAPRKIDYRVSFAPSVFGQKLVMRILDSTYAPTHVRKLCLPAWMQDEVESALRKDAGMLLVCGPTGSGKTTTLYALVRGSNVQQRNAVTIEDPVEIQLDSVTQIPVDESKDQGFASLLRSVLRQDPDVIMIGEIRDAETAKIAMQAALTGHLVFSTIHTRDTVGTIFRLLDLGIEPYLVAQALHLVLAQRLVRQLCPHCKAAYAPSQAEMAAMGEVANGVKRLFKAVGCPKCLGTGYWGRRAFFELLTANDALKDVIVKRPTVQSIQEALLPTRFQPLQHSGYQLVAEGAVAFAEIEKITGQLND